jgi:hypothetical protein
VKGQVKAWPFFFSIDFTKFLLTVLLLFIASRSGLIERFSNDVNQHSGEIGYGVDGRYCCWHIPWHGGKIEETAVVVLRQLLKCGYTASPRPLLPMV